MSSETWARHSVALGHEQGLFVLAELSLLDDEDDLVDDLPAEHRPHVGDVPEAGPAIELADLAPVVVVEIPDHPESPVRVRFEKVGELRGLGRRSRRSGRSGS